MGVGGKQEKQSGRRWRKGGELTHAECTRLMTENLTKNLVDQDEYPACTEIHNRCIVSPPVGRIAGAFSPTLSLASQMHLLTPSEHDLGPVEPS